MISERSKSRQITPIASDCGQAQKSSEDPMTIRELASAGKTSCRAPQVGATHHRPI